MITRIACLLLLVACPVVATADTPPYPYALPDWYVAQKKALEKQVTLDFAGTPLPDVLRFLSEITGAPFKTELPEMGEDESKVDLRVDKLAAGSALRLILSLKGLQLAHGKDGIVITTDASKHPAPEHAGVRGVIEGIRKGLGRPRKPVVDHDAATRKKLADQRITLDFTETPLEDVLQFVQQVAGINIVVSAGARRAGQGQTVTVQMQNTAVGAALRMILQAQQLDYALRGGVVFVDTAARAAAARERTAAARQAAAKRAAQIAALKAKVVGAELQGKRVHELGAPLGAALGVPVRVGPEAWASAVTVGSSTAGKTAAELDTLLSAAGIRLVITPNAAYLVMRPSSRKK